MDYERRGSEPLIEQTLIVHNPNYGEDVLSKLNQLRSEESFTDAVLCVDTVEFPCHRNVMAVSSPYFKAMFTIDLRERNTNKIDVNEVTPVTLRRVIDYAYTGRIEITVDNAQEMLAAGSMFQYPAIVDACCEFLAKHLHSSNCLGIENFAQMHSCSKLEMEAHQYTLENFSSVVEYEEFLEIPLERLVTYLASDLIDVRNEEIVYDAAMLWTRHDLSTRQRHLYQILENIRLVTVDRTYLEDVIEKEPLIQNVEACAFLVEEAKKYHETKAQGQQGARRRSMQKYTIQPRPSTVAKEVIVLVGGLNSLFNYTVQSVEMYEPNKDKWFPLPDIPKNVSWYSVCALENDIYVSGGIVDNQVIPTVWKFDSLQRTWMQMSDMLMPRARHASASWRGKLYVLGGIDLMDDGHLIGIESIECYDIETDTWCEVGQCPMPRKQSHAVPYEDTVVEIGGTQSGAKVSTMECYRCNNNNSLVYSGEQFVLPEPIQFSKIVVINGIFYIIWEDSKKLISLNPDKRTFRRLADMKHTHVHSGAAVLGGKIYVTGGLVDGKPSKMVECYDPALDTWTITKSSRQARACHGCVTIQMC